MSFAEYLKGRISKDYKNLLIQKLEEVKQETETLKSTLAPSLKELHQSLRATLQNELDKLQSLMEEELNTAQQSVDTQVNSLINQAISTWYNTDLAPFDEQQQLLISDIVSNVPVTPRKKNPDLEALRELVQNLDQGSTQSEILNIILQRISDWVDRSILFVVRGEDAGGWAAFGLGAEWDAARVRKLKIGIDKQTILRDVVLNGSAASGRADQYPDNGELFLMIGSTFPQISYACPILVRGKIAGVLYADIGEGADENPDLPDLLYLSCRAAGYAIDLLPMKSKSAPAKTSVPEAAKAQVAVAPPPPPPPPLPEIKQEIAEEVEEAEKAEVAAVEAVDEEPATVMMPAMAAPPIVISPEDQKLHDDAKRFARLLVSEIKLYNEAQVAAGREHKDLYDRLKDDIERSRRMYQERVPTHIHSSTNYFYEELVRSLANGDPTLLGM